MPRALVLTMDDPVLVARTDASGCAAGFPTCRSSPARAIRRRRRELYKAGVTEAVPETLEASLQLSEAVLVDLGVAMGPVIASIHEKRDELRAQIKAEAELDEDRAAG